MIQSFKYGTKSTETKMYISKLLHTVKYYYINMVATYTLHKNFAHSSCHGQVSRAGLMGRAHGQGSWAGAMGRGVALKKKVKTFTTEHQTHIIPVFN